MIRVLDPIVPPQAVGHDVANCVARLFDRIRYEGYDPSKADLSTLRVERSVDPVAVQASIYVEDETWPFPVDRLNPTL